MKVVYVSGPYRNASIRGVVENIRRAEGAAIKIWQMGAACICPHLNTALLDGSCPDDVWLRGDLEIIQRCDALFLVDGWINSKGAQAEKVRAEEIGIPVFHQFWELENWLREKK